MKKYREYGPAPEVKPSLDVAGLTKISDWQTKTYKKPIRDYITGYYGFFPRPNGLSVYIDRAIAKNPAQHKDGEFVEEYVARVKRQPIHIAETAELATALFWTTAIIRQEVLLEAVSGVTEGKDIASDVTAYAADAITDYGYCLENPVDIDYRGRNSGKGLKLQIERIADGVSHSLFEYGKYLEANHQEIHTKDAVDSMRLTITEQQRRIDYWAPRHSAVTELFPEIVVSEEILLHRVPLDEMLDIQTRIPDSV